MDSDSNPEDSNSDLVDSTTSLVHTYLQAAFGGDLGPKGQVWTTESIISGWLFGVIFAVELEEPYSLHANETGWDSDEVYHSVVLCL